MPIWSTRGWQFVGVILAFSGVEAIANLTGVMKLDPAPHLRRRKSRARRRRRFCQSQSKWCSARRFSAGRCFRYRRSFCAGAYRAQRGHVALSRGTLRRYFWRPLVWAGLSVWSSAIVFGLLLISAVNTAIVALIGVFYMMAQDGEMPRPFARLNKHGVPIPLIATAAFRFWCLRS